MVSWVRVVLNDPGVQLVKLISAHGFLVDFIVKIRAVDGGCKLLSACHAQDVGNVLADLQKHSDNPHVCTGNNRISQPLSFPVAACE